MTGKRFTEIEHDYENAWIKCKDDGLFMIYPIYEDETGMPTLGDLLNGLVKENKQLKQQLKYCTAKAKEEIRKQEEENAIRWANIGW